MEVEDIHQSFAFGKFFGSESRLVGLTHFVEQKFVVVHLARLVATGVRRRLMLVSIRRILHRSKLVPAVTDAAEHECVGIHVFYCARMGD